MGSSYRFGNGLLVSSDVTCQAGSPSAYEFDANGEVNHTRRSDDPVLVNLNGEYPVLEGLSVSA